MQEEVYRLWFEYLKLSKNYKRLCELIRKGKPLPKKYKPVIGLMGGVVLDDAEQKKDFPGHIYETYLVFGDIHQETFETFWVKKKEYFERFSKDKGVYPLKDTLPFHAHMLKAARRRSEGREPTVDEFVKYLSNYLPDTLFLQIDLLSGATATEISKQAARYITEGKGAIKGTYDRYHWVSCRNKRPTPKPQIKNRTLNHYLKVYCYYKNEGLKPKQILPELWPGAEYRHEDAIEISRDRLYAERIILNAEKGYFPGDYQGPSE